MKIWTPQMKKMQIEMFGDAYPPCSSLLHYTKEISKNTKENFESQYFEILICRTYSKVV